MNIEFLPLHTIATQIVPPIDGEPKWQHDLRVVDIISSRLNTIGIKFFGQSVTVYDKDAVGGFRLMHSSIIPGPVVFWIPTDTLVSLFEDCFSRKYDDEDVKKETPFRSGPYWGDAVEGWDEEALHTYFFEIFKFEELVAQTSLNRIPNIKDFFFEGIELVIKTSDKISALFENIDNPRTSSTKKDLPMQDKILMAIGKTLITSKSEDGLIKSQDAENPVNAEKLAKLIFEKRSAFGLEHYSSLQSIKNAISSARKK